ncbi:MAG: hypothetical protein NZ534_03030 [Bacteroidia bacterium]|nr:hypothetical protein [Bacteroidia bacterium]
MWRIVIVIAASSAAVRGQWAHTAALRFDLVSPWMGDYRAAFEKKFRPRYVADAWERTYYREYLRYEAPVRRLNEMSRKRSFLSRRCLALQITSGVIVRRRDSRYVRGASLRFDLKNYFRGRGEPSGLYLMFGAGYTFEETLAVRNFFSGSIHVHVPSARMALGWQWLWGRRRTFALDVFAGSEYRQAFRFEQYGRPPHPFPLFPPITFGVQLGFCFAKRSLYF